MVSYEIFSPLPKETIEEALRDPYTAECFLQHTRKGSVQFTSQIVEELFDLFVHKKHLLEASQCRILALQDWWYDIGEVDHEYYYKEHLGLPDKVHTSTPGGVNKNKICTTSGDINITLTYLGLDTSTRFSAAYGISAINALSSKMNAPRKYTEILVDGDLLVYAAVAVEKSEEFIKRLEKLVDPSTITHQQNKIDAQIISQA